MVELPPIQAEVTQYNIHTCCCSRCGKHVRAAVPPEAERGFGPGLMGFLTLLSGEAHLTKRKVCALMGQLGIRISPGALCKIHKLALVLLEGPYEKIRQSVLEDSHINGDETGWKQKGERFTERILTIMSTLKQQIKNAFDYLGGVFQAHIRADPVPSVI